MARDEKYSGRASIKASGRQRSFEQAPGVDVKIRKAPKARDEFSYLRFWCAPTANSV